MIAVGFHSAKKQMSPNPVAEFLNVQGWESLPENKYQPLINASQTGGQWLCLSVHPHPLGLLFGGIVQGL